MSEYNEITAVITTEEPEVAADLDELRYLVFKGKQGERGPAATVPAYLDEGVVRYANDYGTHVADDIYTSLLMRTDINNGVLPFVINPGESDGIEEYFELDYQNLSATAPVIHFRSREHLLAVDSTGHFTLTDRPQGGGLTDDVKQALLDCFEHVAWIDDQGQTYYNALYNALYPPRSLDRITAVYTQSGTVYESDSLDSLKSDLVVTSHYDDQSTEIVPADSYTLSGTLTEGTSTITVSFSGETTTFNVTVAHTPVLSSISAVFDQGSAVIYDTDSLDTLKQYLTVTAYYDDSSTEVVTNYTLSGALAEGTSMITVLYNGKTTTFAVNVTAPATVVSISAVFDQGSAVIYDTDSLDTLKQYLVVTATMSDSTTQTVTGYTLSGTLTEGTSTITVSYGGKTATFNVTVSHVYETVYALHQDSGYAGQINFGLSPQDDGVAKIEVTLDLPNYTGSSNKVLFNIPGWIGFNNTDWKYNNSTTVPPEKVNRALSAVMGQGKQTVVFDGWNLAGNWQNVIIGYGIASYNPEVTWYEIKMYDSNDNIIADWKPTSTTGEFYDSIGNRTITASVATGLEVIEVTT